MPVEYSRKAWNSCKGKDVLKALLRKGWILKRQNGSHKILQKTGFSPYSFSWGDREELNPVAMNRVGKHTDLTPGDL